MVKWSIAGFSKWDFPALAFRGDRRRNGSSAKRSAGVYAELIALNAEILTVEENTLELADTYQKRKILTPNFSADGLHIALATVAEADLLVSWNFKHIVRFDKIRLFNAVNIEFGYKPLQIFSPREVTTYGQED